VRTVAASVCTLYMCVYRWATVMQDIYTDHIRASIRRLRAHLSSLFTSVPRDSKGGTCPNIKGHNSYCDNREERGRNNKKEVFRRQVPQHCRDKNRNIGLTRSTSYISQYPVHSQYYHPYPQQTESVSSIPIKRGALHHTASNPCNPLPPPSKPQAHSKLGRRHSDLALLRQPGPAWQRRTRHSFLSAGVVDDEHENVNDMARRVWRRQMLRRKTWNSFTHLGTTQEGSGSLHSSNSSIKEHIYEEIGDPHSDNDDYDDKTHDTDIDHTESENTNNSFLTLISSARRDNLKYYGCTGWDCVADVT